MKSLRRFLDDEHGATSVEYALVALLIAMAILIGAAALGVNLGAAYSDLAGRIPPVPSS